jgi:hypothetical protein
MMLTASKRVLMIAFHFPPCKGSSGSLRTLNFARHLPKHGWSPIILSANARAYQETGLDQLKDIPPEVPVHRALALDAARHLAIKGRYPSWAALPDRWVSWIPFGVSAGLRLIRKYRPDVLWATYPTASALWIGYLLHRLTGIPLVTDLRDPLTEEDPRTGELYPTNKKLWSARRTIESRSTLASARTVLVTNGSKKLHADRYSQLPNDHWALISNGYDEASFARAEADLGETKRPGGPLRLLHSGTLYPTPDRDPSAFFTALAELKSSGILNQSPIVVTLRASGSVDRYRALIQAQCLEEIVKLEPAIPYHDALKEMLLADGLLVFQGYTSNPAIPAKLYEYLRARRPIFAMADAGGDTAATLRAVGTGIISGMESPKEICQGLTEFLGQLRSGTAPLGDPSAVRHFSRESHAASLAALLDEVRAQRADKAAA